MSVLGERLKKAREWKGLSQTEVFRRIKINNKTLSRYEKGGSEPDVETLNALAELYEVKVDWLTGRSNDPKLEAAPKKSIYDLSAEHIADVVRDVASHYNVDLSNPKKLKAIEDLVAMGIKIIAQSESETEDGK